MLKITKKQNSDWHFTSNWYIYCINCWFCEKYEISSNYQTLSCDCNKLEEKKWYWIQHNKSNISKDLRIFSKWKEKGLIDIEDKDWGNDGKLKKIETKNISKKEMLENLKIINENYILKNKKNIQQKHLNWMKEKNKRKEEKLKKEVEKNVKLIEEKNDFKDKKHLVIWDLHNRIWYLRAAIIVCKKYNLELTILWDLLDREFWYSEEFSSYLIMKEILNNYNNIKINLIFWNHDAWFLKLYNEFKKKNWKIDENELIYYFLIWTKSNGWRETLEHLWFSMYYDLYKKTIQLELKIDWIFNVFKNIFIWKFKDPYFQTFSKFCELYLKEGKISKVIQNEITNEKYLCLHHWVDYDKNWNAKNLILRRLYELEDSKQIEEILDFISWKIEFYEKNWEKWFKLKYPENSTFTFLGRKYNSITKKQSIQLLKDLEVNWIIFWHDNKYENKKENFYGLDNTDLYQNFWFYNFSNENEKNINNSIKIC